MKIKFIHRGLKGASGIMGFETYKDLKKYTDNVTLEEHDASTNGDALFCYESGKMYAPYRLIKANNKGKFSYETAIDCESGTRYACFSKYKFTEKEALELGKRELDTEAEVEIVGNGLMRYRIGYIDDEKRNCWWLDNIDKLDGIAKIKNAVPVWVVAIKEEL